MHCWYVVAGFSESRLYMKKLNVNGNGISTSVLIGFIQVMISWNERLWVVNFCWSNLRFNGIVYT